MKVLELYCGIGGMHMALNESKVCGEVVAAIDINPVATEVYKHNFSKTQVLNRNILSLTTSWIKKLEVDTILMSPPCQPFTRNGLQKDTKDPRTESFQYLIKLIPDSGIKHILMENVKGFENSDMHNEFINMLKMSGYSFQEFLLSPTQFGIPNSRTRYYCIATKNSNKFTGVELKEDFKDYVSFEGATFKISTVLEKNQESLSNYYLPQKVLSKHSKVLDICYQDSTKSCCFTKSYGRFIEGTGSVFSEKNCLEVKEAFETEDLENILGLKLRFFTPMEVSRLMSFPNYFNFPNQLSDRKKYMLLGNSINVKVVAELIKLFDV